MKTQLMKRAAALCLAVVLAVSLCVPALAAQKNYSASDYVQRLKDSVRGSATVDLDAGKDPHGPGAGDPHLPGHSLSRPVSGRGPRGRGPDLHRGERAQKGHRPD